MVSKKLGVSALLSLIVLTLALAACGDSTNTPATTTQAATTAAMTTSAAGATTAAMTTAAMTTAPAMTTAAMTTAAMTTAAATMDPNMQMTSAAAMTTNAAMTTSAAMTTAAQAGDAKVMNITIENYKFNPETLEIPVGTKVIWTNKDSAGHTVTSDTGDTLKSSLIPQNGTFEYTFTKPGTYSYHCLPHPFMKATITVK